MEQSLKNEKIVEDWQNKYNDLEAKVLFKVDENHGERK